jgi:hypothetical protein
LLQRLQQKPSGTFAQVELELIQLTACAAFVVYALPAFPSVAAGAALTNIADGKHFFCFRTASGATCLDLQYTYQFCSAA